MNENEMFLFEYWPWFYCIKNKRNKNKMILGGYEYTATCFFVGLPINYLISQLLVSFSISFKVN